jgi:hypothetical protein
MKTLQIVNSKTYWEHAKCYELHTYSDGTHSYNKYAQRFLGTLECITWGKAMDKAIADRADALQRIKQLEVDLKIVGE